MNQGALRGHSIREPEDQSSFRRLLRLEASERMAAVILAELTGHVRA